MRKIIFIFYFILLYQYSFAQNLVLSASFENPTNCPNNQDQITLLSGCFPIITPNIFNSCADSLFMGCACVPSNFFGSQYPRTGQGYSGGGFANFGIDMNDSLIHDSTWVFMELLGMTLKSKLTPNKSYCASFFVSLANRLSNIAIDGISMLIISDSIPDLHWEPTLESVLIQFPKMEHPQINNPSGNIIDDTIKWIKIEGVFIAQGDEKFLYIGNFKRLKDIHWKIVPYTDHLAGCASYYYIDDVTVYPCDAPVYFADAGKDTCISSGESVVLGSPGREEYLYWWSDGKRGIGNSGSITVSPTQTTTYYLVQKDFKFDETRDSVTVRVGNCNGNPDYSGESFQIYPNPNDGNFQVRFNRLVPEDAILQLFDMLGRQIGEYLLTGNGNIASLRIEVSKSLYYAKVVAPDFQTKSVKIVILK